MIVRTFSSHFRIRVELTLFAAVSCSHCMCFRGVYDMVPPAAQSANVMYDAAGYSHL